MILAEVAVMGLAIALMAAVRLSPDLTGTRAGALLATPAVTATAGAPLTSSAAVS